MPKTLRIAAEGQNEGKEVLRLTPLRKRRPVAFWEDILPRINPEYQGWAASIIWFNQSTMDGSKFPDPRIKAKWSVFHAQYVPMDVPAKLKQTVLIEEFARLGILMQTPKDATRSHHIRNRAKRGWE